MVHKIMNEKLSEDKIGNHMAVHGKTGRLVFVINTKAPKN